MGAVAVTFLVTKFAPGARIYGVPGGHVGGVIRPVVAVIKLLASAIAIGTGAAIGREGPIIQIVGIFSWPGDVVGVITKEHVADSVANSVRVYPG
jgi:H+/Cl- antiporter ClcA